MPFARSDDGTHLFFQDWGSGRPVVLIHGWSLSSQIWEYSVADLTGHGVRCIAYDRRGHGRSDQPGHGYDFDTLSDDLAAILEHLDLRDVTLLGHSMGAGEVVRYLSRHGSERVARIVLAAPVTPFLLRTEDNPGGLDAGFFEMLVQSIRADRPGFLAAGIASFAGEGALSPAMLDWVTSIALQASAGAVVECIRSYSTTDFRADLRAVGLPALILQGDADTSAPLELTGRPTHAAITASELRIYEGAPHALFLTHRERLLQDILREVSGTSRERVGQR